MNSSIDHMKLAAFQELKEALEVKRMNDELLEYLASSLRFISRYCKKYNIPIPEDQRIYDMINKLISIENKNSPPKSKHPFSTPDDETEPNFTLSSGRKSRFYLDLRILQSYPVYFRKAISLLTYLIQSQIGFGNFDYICSVPTSGTIFGSALSYELFKPHIYIRKDLKSYGMQKKIEGDFEPNSKILLVDDVITTGHSILSGIESLANHPNISGVVVLVDRQQGSKDILDKFAIKIKSAIPIHQIIKILNDKDRIDKNEYEAIKKEIEEY